MWIVLLVVGILFVLGAVAAALVAAGRTRIIQPVLSGLIGLICLVAAFALRPAATHPSSSSAQPSGAAVVAAGPAKACGSGSAALGPDEENPMKGLLSPGPTLPRTLPEDVQHLPATIPGLTGQIGDVVNSPAFQNIDMRESTIAMTLGYVMRDVDSVHYSRVAGDQNGSDTMRVEVGTPKPGACPVQLTTTALGNFEGGGHISGIHRITATGPRLAAIHAVLTCGGVPGAASSCAWAGTGPKGTPFFGFFYGFVILPDAQLAQLVDQLYGAFTG